MSPSGTMSGDGPDSGDNDRFLRWQDITRRSLDFVNNVLIVLTSGLIAVVLNEAANATTVASLHRWQLVCAGTAVILLGVSVAVGVFTAANRLQSGRLTARRLRIGMLYSRMLSADRDADRKAYREIASVFQNAKDAFAEAAGAWDAVGSGDRAEQALACANEAGEHSAEAKATANGLQTADQAGYAARRTRIAALARQAAELARDAGREAVQAATDPGTSSGAAALPADSASEKGDQVAGRAEKPERLWDETSLTRLIRNLAGLDSVTRLTIKSAAKGCLAEKRQRVVRDDDAIEGLQRTLREWSDKADNRTWWLIRIQLWSFLLGSAFFAAVPIWILLSAS